MASDRAHHRVIQPVRSAFVRTHAIQRVGPMWDQRLHIDFRDDYLTAFSSAWRSRTSLVNRHVVVNSDVHKRSENLFDLLDPTLLAGLNSRDLIPRDVVDSGVGATSRTQRRHAAGAPKGQHREYDIMFSEWASVVAAQAPWMPCSFPTVTTMPADLTLNEAAKKSGYKLSGDAQATAIDAFEDLKAKVARILTAWEDIAMRPGHPLSLLIADAHLLHCGLPAYALHVGPDGDVDVLVGFPSRDVLVHAEKVDEVQRVLRSGRLAATERSDAQRNAEYSRELVRFLLAIGRAVLASLPAANSVRLLAVREEDLESWPEAELCADFALTVDTARELGGLSTQWVDQWCKIVEELQSTYYVNGRFLEKFVADFGDELLHNDAKIIKSLGPQCRASIAADGSLLAIGHIRDVLRSSPRLFTTRVDSFPIRADLYSLRFWLDLHERGSVYQAELEEQANKSRQATPTRSGPGRSANSAPSASPAVARPTSSRPVLRARPNET